MGVGSVFAQKLTIQVENADIGQGYLMVGVFNDEENFPNNYFRREKVAISDNVMVIVFDNLPFGQYAVSVYPSLARSNACARLRFWAPCFPLFMISWQGVFGPQGIGGGAGVRHLFRPSLSFMGAGIKRTHEWAYQAVPAPKDFV
jgi:hypothetical protein